jgi:hypothetical protein
LAASALLGLSLLLSAADLAAQVVTVRVENDALHLRAAAFSFIKGQILARLKDGRSVPFDFELVVLARPGTTAVAQARERFVLSYDLWEERFAVTQAGMPVRSASHLTARAAETWCLDRLAIPLGTLGRLGRDAPLWIRLEYRVPAEAVVGPEDAGLTLRGLVDRLSRRPARGWQDAIEAGPLTLIN